LFSNGNANHFYLKIIRTKCHTKLSSMVQNTAGAAGGVHGGGNISLPFGGRGAQLFALLL
jgi:hypothetical protein